MRATPLSPQDTWTPGTSAYVAAHQYVYYIRGNATVCQHCDSQERIEWANLTKQYHDPDDYISLCRPCHRQMDLKPLCPQGHEYDAIDQGNRRCSTCKNLRRRQRYNEDPNYRDSILEYNRQQRR